MGIYLSSPKTEKFSEDGENVRVRYGLSSMQGWRAAMEDAHAAITDLDASTSFFGVYDGHGGKLLLNFVPSIYINKCSSMKRINKEILELQSRKPFSEWMR